MREPESLLHLFCSLVYVTYISCLLSSSPVYFYCFSCVVSLLLLFEETHTQLPLPNTHPHKLKVLFLPLSFTILFPLFLFSPFLFFLFFFSFFSFFSCRYFICEYESVRRGIQSVRASITFNTISKVRERERERCTYRKYMWRLLVCVWERE